MARFIKMRCGADTTYVNVDQLEMVKPQRRADGKWTFVTKVGPTVWGLPRGFDTEDEVADWVLRSPVALHGGEDEEAGEQIPSWKVIHYIKGMPPEDTCGLWYYPKPNWPDQPTEEDEGMVFSAYRRVRPIGAPDDFQSVELTPAEAGEMLRNLFLSISEEYQTQQFSIRSFGGVNFMNGTGFLFPNGVRISRRFTKDGPKLFDGMRLGETVLFDATDDDEKD